MQLKDSRKDETNAVRLSPAIELSEQIQESGVYPLLGSFDGTEMLSEIGNKRMSLMGTCGTKMRGNIPPCCMHVLTCLHVFLCRVYRAFLQLIVFQMRACRRGLLETELLNRNDVHVRYSTTCAS